MNFLFIWNHFTSRFLHKVVNRCILLLALSLKMEIFMIRNWLFQLKRKLIPNISRAIIISIVWYSMNAIVLIDLILPQDMCTYKLVQKNIKFKWKSKFLLEFQWLIDYFHLLSCRVRVHMFNLYQNAVVTKELIEAKKLHLCRLAIWLCLFENGHYIPISERTISSIIQESKFDTDHSLLWWNLSSI